MKSHMISLHYKLGNSILVGFNCSELTNVCTNRLVSCIQDTGVLMNFHSVLSRLESLYLSSNDSFAKN